MNDLASCSVSISGNVLFGIVETCTGHTCKHNMYARVTQKDVSYIIHSIETHFKGPYNISRCC